MSNSNITQSHFSATIRFASVALCLLATGLAGNTSSYAQSSDYKPGGSAPIVFTDYGSKGSAGASNNSGAAGSVPTSNSTAGAYASDDGEANSKGLGSLFRGVKQELQNAGSSYARQNSYRNNQNGSVYSQSVPSYSNGVPVNNYRPDAVQERPSNFGSGNPQRPYPGYAQNSGYSQNNSSGGAYGSGQNEPQISGNLMDIVKSNPPGPVDGDLENLMPAELHKKAYGIELHRNGPLNGAEDPDHLF